MICSSCSKLAFLYIKKSCLRCQSTVVITIAVICELCSTKDNICSICLKKIQKTGPKLGCNCGSRK